jgi:hypothetical protein
MYSCFGANIRGRRAKDGLNAPPYTEVQIPWALCIVEDDGDPRSASGWQPKVNGLIGGPEAEATGFGGRLLYRTGYDHAWFRRAEPEKVSRHLYRARSLDGYGR